MKKKGHIIKHASVLLMVGVATSVTSGGVTYAALSAAVNNNSSYVEPDIDDNSPTEESGFSKALNSVLSAKEILNGNLNLNIKIKDSKPIQLGLSSLDVDLSQLSSTIINVATDMNVKYNGIDQDLGLRIENDETCYVSLKNFNNVKNNKKANFVFNAPQNIVDLLNILKSCGVLVVNTDSSITDSLDFSALLSDAQEYINKLTVSEEHTTNEENIVSFTVEMTDGLEIDNTKVEGIKLEVYAKKVANGDSYDYTLTGLKTLNENGIVISTKDNEADTYSTIMSLTLDGSFELKDVSTYQVYTDEDISSNGYHKVTDANSSVLSTVASIIGHSSDVGITVSYGDKFTIDGLMQAKVTDGNFLKGTYALKLNHLSDDKSTETLNDLYAYHYNETTYLKFNNLIKAKVTDTSLSEMFTYISEGSGSKAIEDVSSDLNMVLGSLDITALTNGDFTTLQGLLDSTDTYIDYDDTANAFVLSIDGKYLGVSEGALTIIVTTNGAKGVKTITVNGLKINDETLSIKLNVQKSTDFDVIEDSEYSDFKGGMPIFKTILDLIGEKKFVANYSLTFNDKIEDGTESNYNNITATGSLGADLSNVSTSKLLDTVSDGSYYLSMKAYTAKSNYSHNLDMVYQNQNLYFGYDALNSVDANKSKTIFKNYISHAQLGEMKTVLNSKTESNVSTALVDTDTILSLLGTSDSFNSDLEKLKKGSLKGLESFLKIETKDDDIVVTLDLSKVFKDNSLIGKNISAITLTLNNSTKDDELVFEDIEISTVISSTQSFSFKLSFEEYKDFTITDISSYTELTEVSKLTKAFYSLATDSKKYGVKVSAEYRNTLLENQTDYETNIVLDGGCKYDFTSDEPLMNGYLDITHPYVALNGLTASKTSAKQNIKFDYQSSTNADGAKDNQFTADYNDKMHILMHSSTVSDVVSVASSISETNLLTRLLDTSSSVASSMPIKDVIALKAPSILLDYPYINEVKIDESANTLTLKIDKRLFNLDKEGDYVSIVLSYSDGDDPRITSLEVSISNSGDTICKGKIELVSYDSVSDTKVFEYNEDNKSKFVDLDGFSSLTKMMINTTEFNYYHLSGTLNLDLSLFNGETQTPINLDSYCFDLNINLDVYVKDQEVYTYLSIQVGDEEMGDANFYVTEYAFKDGYVYIDNTRVDKVYSATDETITKTVSSLAYKVTEEEFKSNILYYFVSLGLDIDDRIAGKTIMANIYKAMAEEKDEGEENPTDATSLTDDLKIDLSSDFSSLFTAGAIYNKQKQKFTFDLDLNSILKVSLGDDSILSFSSTYLKLYHQTYTFEDGSTFTPFYALQLSTEVSLLDDLAKVSLKGQFISSASNGDLLFIDETNEEDKALIDNKMSRFNSLTSYLDKNIQTASSISSIDIKYKNAIDLTTYELTKFANDYAVVTTGDVISYSISYDDYVKASEKSTLIYNY